MASTALKMCLRREIGLARSVVVSGPNLKSGRESIEQMAHGSLSDLETSIVEAQAVVGAGAVV